MSYTIQIAEYQRKIIQIALANLSFEAVNEINRLEVPSFEDNQIAAASSLHSMVVGLPEDEAKYPGVIHGFAL